MQHRFTGPQDAPVPGFEVVVRRDRHPHWSRDSAMECLLIKRKMASLATLEDLYTNILSGLSPRALWCAPRSGSGVAL